jgi:hypothetical protein
MCRSLLVTAMVAVALAGCAMGPGKVGEPLPVSGRVTFADGRPVTDVFLVLSPVEKGRPDNLKLGADGSFSGSAVPGKYSFYFVPQTGKLAAMKGIPEKYRSHQIEKLVTISGGEVTISLD